MASWKRTGNIGILPLVKGEGAVVFEFGSGRKLKLPEIGLGTWRIGGGFTPDHSDDESSVRIVRDAVDMGYGLIDTAEMYGSGNAESIVGRAVEGKDVFIATKVSQSNLRYDDVIRSANGSLKRLGVKKIDLYQVHWPSDSIPLRETMSAMEKLAEQGKIDYIGVSNFDVQLLEDARSCLSREDVVTNQVSYSLLDRTPEYELMDYCRKENIGILAYEPLSRKRVLSGRIGESVLEVAGRTGRTPAQVALNWIITRGAIPIPKSTVTAHLLENLGSVDWRLSNDDMRRLDNAAK